MSATSAPLTSLGRYRLVKVLGRGAMGLVYEGIDPRLERTVAIKTILKSHLLDQTLADEYSARFVREAQAAARLNHPNIVTVFDFGEQDDVAYLVMEFIRGRELAAAFEARERFPLPQALRIMDELLGALGYAHAQGVVHRDVKPANVMLDAAGRVKLTDFGVARLADAGQDRTAPGTMVGTPSYMSPEQIQGLAVGSRADLFAAGIILYQFLTGQRPFAGGGPFEIQKKIVQEDPVPPSVLDPSLPPAFDRIVRHAMAKAPQDRYASAAEFAAELRSVALPAGAAAPVAPPVDPDATVVVRSVAPPKVAEAPAVAPAAPVAAPVVAPAATPVAAPVTARAPNRRPLVLAGVALAAAFGVAAWWFSSSPGTTGLAAPPAASAPLPVPGLARDPVGSAAPIENGRDGPHDAPPTTPVPVTTPSPSLQGPADPAASQPGATTVAPSKPVPRRDPRCAAWRERIQVGETLPPEQQSFFEKECR